METVTEFQVNMSCQNCVNSISEVLSKTEGISNFDIDLKAQSVLITSNKPSVEVQKLLETTGKKAVIAGQSGVKDNLGCAVVMIGGQIGCSIDPAVQGVVRFTQIDEEQCVIDGTIDGLTPGLHGFAIHESGDLSLGCQSVGEHYNPRNCRHGSPNDKERHVGDLGNISASLNGRADFKFVDKLIKVWDIIGRSVVVASGPDDLGIGSNQISKINGNSGEKTACGIIARSSGLFQNSKRFCACDGVTLWDERDKPLTGLGRRQ